MYHPSLMYLVVDSTVYLKLSVLITDHNLFVFPCRSHDAPPPQEIPHTSGPTTLSLPQPPDIIQVIHSPHKNDSESNGLTILDLQHDNNSRNTSRKLFIAPPQSHQRHNAGQPPLRLDRPLCPRAQGVHLWNDHHQCDSW